MIRHCFRFCEQDVCGVSPAPCQSFLTRRFIKKGKEDTPHEREEVESSGGRDPAPVVTGVQTCALPICSAPTLLAELDARLDEIGLGRVVDGVGRGVVLDRDKNYDKVKRAYDAMVDGVGTLYE